MNSEFSVYKFEKSLRRSEQSVYRRLRSIVLDAKFVDQFRCCHGLPLVANLRCGLWYAKSFDGECYFKVPCLAVQMPIALCYLMSTDGHYGKWQINLRRINLNVLKLCLTNPDKMGVIIVDSTRKGKPFPDSYNRTIPIWATVINRAFFHFKLASAASDNERDALRREEESWTALQMPPWISASEKAQIAQLLPGILQSVLQSEPIAKTILELAPKFPKPVRAVLINPHSEPWAPNFHQLEYIPIVCISASRVVDGAATDSEYIQGAADDHETWSKGLEAKLFWANVDYLLSSEEDIDDRVEMLVRDSKITHIDQIRDANADHITYAATNANTSAVNSNGNGDVSSVDSDPTSSVYVEVRGVPLCISSSAKVCAKEMWEYFDCIINVSELVIPEFDLVTDIRSKYREANVAPLDPFGEEVMQYGKEYLHISVPIGKEAKWVLTRSLPTILRFALKHLRLGHKLLIFDAQDISLAFGVAVAIVANFFSERGALRDRPCTEHTKDSLRSAFYFMQQRCFEAKVSRLVIAEINRFFLSPSQTSPPHLKDYWAEMQKL